MAGLVRSNEEPVYTPLYRDLKKQLLSGRIKPGACLQGEHQLSKSYGISRPSVRKALGLLIREALIHKVQGKGTFAGPCTVLTGTIGLVHAETGDVFPMHGFYAHIFRKIRACLRKRDHHLLLVPGLRAVTERHSPADIAAKVEGLIIMGIMDDDYVRALASAEIPSVSIDYWNENLGLDSVVTDDYGGAHSGTTHLAELGHKRIAYLGATIHYPWKGVQPEASSEIRVQAYRHALAENGIHELYVGAAEVCSIEGGYAAMMDLLDNTPDITAVLVFDNIMALGAMKALQERGLVVPRDISVVAFEGDEDVNRLFDPTLTLLRAMTAEEMGQRAVDMLFSRMKDPDQPVRRSVIPFKLFPGDSAARPGKSRPTNKE
ncbi:GntR family transcriptional regulator [Planctomycetota bacterium]